MWELSEVLTWEVERLRGHAEGLGLLVGAVLEAEEPERTAALELLSRVLERVSPPLPEVPRPKLRRLLVDSRAQVRHLAAEWLGVDREAPEAPEAWAVTLEVVRAGRRGEQRAKAVARLWGFGPRPEAVPVLLEGLRQDPDAEVRGPRGAPGGGAAHGGGAAGTRMAAGVR